MTNDTDFAHQRLEDCAAINQLNTDFAWGLDAHERDRFLDIFAEDVEYLSSGRRYQGRADLAQFFHARKAGGRVSRHICSGLDITFISADEAASRAIWLTFAGSEPVPIGSAAPYQVADIKDVYRRADGKWKIFRREIQTIFRNPDVPTPPRG